VADHQFGIKHYAGEVITSTHSVILVLLPVLFVSLERFYKVCRKLKCIKLTSDFICCYVSKLTAGGMTISVDTANIDRYTGLSLLHRCDYQEEVSSGLPQSSHSLSSSTSVTFSL